MHAPQLRLTAAAAAAVTVMLLTAAVDASVQPAAAHANTSAIRALPRGFRSGRWMATTGAEPDSPGRREEGTAWTVTSAAKSTTAAAVFYANDRGRLIAPVPEPAPQRPVGIFDCDGEELRVWRDPSGWHACRDERQTQARFLDAALENVLGHAPDVRLVLQILEWDVHPELLH